MRKRSVILVFLFLTLAMVSVPAFADNIAVGPPEPAHSWYQGFIMNNAGSGSSWNSFQVYIYGVPFEAPGVVTYNGAPWVSTFSNNLITGSTLLTNWTSDLYFKLAFLPNDTTVPFYMDVFQFNNGTLLTSETTRATWDGHTWTMQVMPNLAVPVPEPSTTILIGISLLVGGALKRRLRA